MRAVLYGYHKMNPKDIQGLIYMLQLRVVILLERRSHYKGARWVFLCTGHMSCDLSSGSADGFGL